MLIQIEHSHGTTHGQGWLKSVQIHSIAHLVSASIGVTITRLVTWTDGTDTSTVTGCLAVLGLMDTSDWRGSDAQQEKRLLDALARSQGWQRREEALTPASCLQEASKSAPPRLRFHLWIVSEVTAPSPADQLQGVCSGSGRPGPQQGLY